MFIKEKQCFAQSVQEGKRKLALCTSYRLSNLTPWYMYI